jgi:hypothetical protein
MADEQTPPADQGTVATGYIYAPYIPLYSTPTVLPSAPPEPTIIEWTAALDEETGGPAREMIAKWEEHQRKAKESREEMFRTFNKRQVKIPTVNPNFLGAVKWSDL